MNVRRRELLHLAIGAGALPAVSRTARAQSYPARPVRVIVGFPAGGAADTTARIIGQYLSEHLGQPFVIENRAGAAGNIGTEVAAKASADGYTLLAAVLNNAVNATLYEKLNFNFIRDIAPVAGLIRFANVLDVHPSLPVSTVPEFIAYAKANPGKINMGSSGVGSPQHVSGELFKMMTGVELVHVPYRGGAPAVADLIAGQLQVIFDVLPESIGHIRAGKLRHSRSRRERVRKPCPRFPASAISCPDMRPARGSASGCREARRRPSSTKLNREINAALADPKIQARFADLGATVLPGSPADFGKLVADETEKWARVVKFAGMRAD